MKTSEELRKIRYGEAQLLWSVISDAPELYKHLMSIEPSVHGFIETMKYKIPVAPCEPFISEKCTLHASAQTYSLLLPARPGARPWRCCPQGNRGGGR
jgi:hypothetical protein